MRTASVVVGMLCGWLILGGVGCSVPTDSAFWLASGRSVETGVIDVADVDRVLFEREPVREFLLDEIGYVSQVRVWSDTVVGIVDGMACQAVLLDIAGEDVRYIRRFGTCGDGPAEFREPTDLFLDGDTLIVVDQRHLRLTFLSMGSGESREVRIPQFASDPWAPLEIITADSLSVVLLASLPGGGVNPKGGMVRTIRREDASLLESHLPDAPFPGSNPARQPRRTSACWDPETDRIVVANRWRPERIILDREGHALARLVSSVPWIDEAESIDNSGGLAPAAYVRLRCGGGLALIFWRGRPRTLNANRYLMELIGTDGSVHLVEHGEALPQRHPATFGIGGRSRNGWVLYSNLDSAGPKLFVFDWSPSSTYVRSE